MSEGFGLFGEGDLSLDADNDSAALEAELSDIAVEDIQAGYEEIQLQAELDAESLSERFDEQVDLEPPDRERGEMTPEDIHAGYEAIQMEIEEDADSLSDMFHEQPGLAYRQQNRMETGEVSTHTEGFDSSSDASLLENDMDALGEGMDDGSQDVGEIYEWLDEINPNYDPFDSNDSPYHNNCGSCALAVAMHLDGIKDYEASENNVGNAEMMNEITGAEQVSMSPQEIESFLMSQGPGAHGIVGIDRAEGPGHWFNAYYDGSKVMAIDGQTGDVHDWPPDYGEVINWDISVDKGA